MDSLEGLARTMEAVDDIGSIVRTMKALAAVSIRQYERAVRSLGQYYRTVELGLHVVLRDMPPPAARRRAHGAPIGAIVFGSDHGLCGRFNEDLRDLAAEHLARWSGHPGVRLLAVGGRVAALLREAGHAPGATLGTSGSAAGITRIVDDVLRAIDAWQEDAGVETVHVFHSRATARAAARPASHRLLPVDLHRLRRLEEEPWPSRVLPTFSMNRERLFAAFIRQYLFVMIFRACAESAGAEHASRLSAMQSAERSLEERRAELVAEFRRRRQETITAELLDVVAGFEALADAEPQGSRRDLTAPRTPPAR